MGRSSRRLPLRTLLPLLALGLLAGAIAAQGCGNSDDPSECTYYQNEVGPEPATLVITNTLATPVYLTPRACALEPELTLTDAGGALVDRIGPECGDACTDVALGTQCPDTAACEQHALLELVPGGKITVTWDGGAWQDEDMPGVCAYELGDAPIPCRLERAVEGSFTLAFTVFTEATCGGAACSCAPTSGDLCAIDGPATTGATLSVKTNFTFPLSNPQIPIEIPIQ